MVQRRCAHVPASCCKLTRLCRAGRLVPALLRCAGWTRRGWRWGPSSSSSGGLPGPVREAGSTMSWARMMVGHIWGCSGHSWCWGTAGCCWGQVVQHWEGGKGWLQRGGSSLVLLETGLGGGQEEAPRGPPFLPLSPITSPPAAAPRTRIIA